VSLAAAAPPVIRRATSDDALGCARVHHTSWVETYSGLLPADHWESDTLTVRAATWQRWLAGDGTVTVAEHAGEIIGIAFGSVGRQIGDHPPARERELWLLYVLEAHHGTGVGQAR